VGNASVQTFLAGHKFPRHDDDKNDYPEDIGPAPSVLELFLIYHWSTSQNCIYYATAGNAKARLWIFDIQNEALTGSVSGLFPPESSAPSAAVLRDLRDLRLCVYRSGGCRKILKR
jgi:hypothetical protein